jgi:hypothetical protein
MSNDDIVSDLSSLIDYLDKLIYLIKDKGFETREQDIAIQKLEEAVFWLSYGLKEGDKE